MEDNITLGSQELAKLATPDDTPQDVKTAVNEYEADQKMEAEYGNDAYRAIYGRQITNALNAGKEFEERYTLACRGEVEPRDDDERMAFSRYTCNKYLGVDDPSGKALTQFVTAVDADAKIVSAKGTDVVKRDYNPQETWEICKNAANFFANYACYGVDGISRYEAERAARPLGLTADEFADLQKNNRAELVRKIRDSKFYDGKTTMLDTLGQFYDYEKGTYDEARAQEMAMVQNAAAYGSPGAAAAMEMFITSRQAKGEMTTSDAEKIRLGNERADAMIARYKNDTANVRNIMFAALSAKAIADDPNVARYWNAYASVRQRNRGWEEAGYENQEGDIQKLVETVTDDFKNCQTERERKEVFDRYNRVLTIIQNDDSRNGYAHRDSWGSITAALFFNTGTRWCNAIGGMFKDSGQMIGDFYSVLPKGMSKASTDKAFETYARRAVTAAGASELYSENTMIGKVFDETVDLTALAVVMRGFSVSGITRTTGAVMNLPARGVERLARIPKLNAKWANRLGAASDVMAKPGNALIRVADKMSPMVRATHKAEVTDQLDANRKILDGIIEGDLNEAYMLGDKVAELEGNIARAEKALAKNFGNTFRDWSLTIANEAPGLFLMESSSLYQKKCNDAYAIGQKMENGFAPELLDAANTYELLGTAGETICFAHLPKLFMDGVLGKTMSTKFNGACKNVITEFERMSSVGNTTGIQAFFDYMRLWQQKMLVNSLKGANTMGMAVVAKDVADNYMNDRLRQLGVDLGPNKTAGDIMGDYVRSAASGAIAMHASGTLATAKPAVQSGVKYKNAYLDYRSLTNVDHAIQEAMLWDLRSKKDETSVIRVDGKEVTVSNWKELDGIAGDAEKKRSFIEGLKKTNRAAYEEISGKVYGWLDELLKHAGENLDRHMPTELRDEMRGEIGESATRFLENVLEDMTRGTSEAAEQINTVKDYRTAKLRDRQEKYLFGEKLGVGEYDTKAVQEVFDKFFGFKLTNVARNEDGSVEFDVNPSGFVNRIKGGSGIIGGKLVIRKGKIELMTGGKYKQGYVNDIVQGILERKNGFEDAAFDSFRERAEELKKAKETRDPNGILKEILPIMKDHRIGVHGYETLEGNTPLIVMNRDDNGNTRFEVGHELAHGVLELMRVNKMLTEEMENSLAKLYGAEDGWRERVDYSWEESFVGDFLSQFIKSNGELAKIAAYEVEKKFGDGFLAKVKDAVSQKYGEIGNAFKRLHDSFLRVDAEKSDIEKFVENRLSNAQKAAEAEKTADKRREEAAEHLKAFDETLAEKVASGERIGADEVGVAGSAEAGGDNKPTTASGTPEAELVEEDKREEKKSAEALQIEDKTKALVEAGYVMDADGSWICEKTNPVAWHRAMLKSAKEKLLRSEELTPFERKHVGVVINDRAETVDFVQCVDGIIDGEHGIKFVDENGDAVDVDNVAVAPFPASNDKAFLKAAGSRLAPAKFGVSADRYRDIRETDRVKKAELMAEVSKEVDNRQKFMDVFDRTTEHEIVVGDTLIQRNFHFTPWKDPSKAFNAGAVHAMNHVLECGLTYDTVRVNGRITRVMKSPITAQELNDYLPICLEQGKVKPGKYKGTYYREYRMSDGKIMRAVVVPLSEAEAKRTGAKFGLITVMSDRRGWEVEKLIKKLAEGQNVQQIPEGRADQLPTGDSIPNYLKGFKGAPNQKANNEKIDAMLKAQLDENEPDNMKKSLKRGRLTWMPDDLRIDLTEEPIMRPVKFGVSGPGAEMARRIKEEAEKIGAVTRVEDAVTGKPAILLGYHGTRKGGFTKFEPYTTNDGYVPSEEEIKTGNFENRGVFMAGTKNTAQSYVGNLPRTRKLPSEREAREKIEAYYRGKYTGIRSESDIKYGIRRSMSQYQMYKRNDNLQGNTVDDEYSGDPIFSVYDFDTSVWNNPSRGVAGNNALGSLLRNDKELRGKLKKEIEGRLLRELGDAEFVELIREYKDNGAIGLFVDTGVISLEDYSKISRAIYRDLPGKGIYNLAMRFENPLVIDAKNREWNKIKLQEDKAVPLTREELEKIREDKRDSIMYAVDETIAELIDAVFQNASMAHDLAGTNFKINYTELISGKYDSINNVIESLKKAGYAHYYEILELLKKKLSALSEDGWEKLFLGEENQTKIIHAKRHSTRDLAIMAQKNGRDGVIIKNCIDNGGQGNLEVGPDTIFINFDGKNVKMVDDLTYDDNGNIIPAERRLDWSNPDARFMVGGVRGLERAVGPKKYKELVKELNDVYRNTYNHIFAELYQKHADGFTMNLDGEMVRNTRGGMRKPRMWQIEKAMQDGSVVLSAKINGKTMRVHYTGAGYAIDPKNANAKNRELLANPRLEYDGDTVELTGEIMDDLKGGVKVVRVGDVLSDKTFAKFYPSIANAKIVVADENTPVDANGPLPKNVVESLSAEDIAQAKFVRDFTVRQDVKALNGRRRKMLCSFVPKYNTIVVYEGAVDAKKKDKLEKDLMQSIVDMIGAEEKWGNGVDLADKTKDQLTFSKRNNALTGNGGMVEDSFYRTYALFGDPKLSLIDRNSLLNKVIAKYVRKYAGNADAVTVGKVRDAIRDVLSDAYMQFAGIKESKAWARRSKLKGKALAAKDNALIDIDKTGITEPKAQQESTHASEMVIKFYDEKIADMIDKKFGKFFKENDKTFRKLFEDARREYAERRAAETALREFNPTKVRNEAQYLAYVDYCKKNGKKPKSREEVMAYLNSEEGKLGRKKVANKIKGSRMTSLDTTVGKSGTATKKDMLASNGGLVTSSRYEAIASVFAEMGGSAKRGENGKDVWIAEKDVAVDEIVKMLKSGKVGPNRAPTEMLKIIAKHSSTESTATLSERLSEITGDIAKKMQVKFSVSGRKAKSAEDYLVEAAAARMVRSRIYGIRAKNEESTSKWIDAEAKKLHVNDADVAQFSKRVNEAADKIANTVMAEIKSEASVNDIKRMIGKLGRVNGMGRDIASAFVRGNGNGVVGEYATRRAEDISNRIFRHQMRNATGLKLAELNSRLGMDIVNAIESVGREGSPYADGGDLATAIDANFKDAVRRLHPEYATMNDEELVNDRRVRNEYAETVSSWMRETAKRIAYGKLRRDAEVEAARWSKDAPPTFAYLKGVVTQYADNIAAYIRQHGSLDSARMVKSVCSYIDKVAKAQSKAKQGELNVKRKFDPVMQNYWNIAKKAMSMTSDKVDERLDVIRAELDSDYGALAKAAASSAKEIDADEIMRKRSDLMTEYNCLMKYGALIEKSVGEIHDVFEHDIAPDLAGAADEFNRITQAKLTEYKRVIEAMTKEINAFRDRKGQSFNALKNNDVRKSFVINSIADLFKRMEAYLHEGSDAYEVVEQFRRDMSLAHINFGNFTMNWETELRKAVKKIYGKNFENVVEELSVKDEKYDEFSRSGWELSADKSSATAGKTGTNNLPTRLSKANLIYIYLARRQDDMQENNRIFGCDDAYMDRLMDCLDEKDLALANWITNAYATMRDQISPVSERITGLRVKSPTELYCPLEFIHDKISGNSRMYSANPFPTFLTRRTSHDTARLNEAQDVLRMFENRIQDAGHYIAFGEIIEKATMTFKDAKVQNAYANLLGTKAKNDIYAQMSQALMGDRRDAGGMLNGVRNFITATSLFGNVGSAMKQLEGCGGWAIEMGMIPFLKGLVVNRVTSSEVRQGMRELDASGIFKIRGEEGISEAMVALANSMDGVKDGPISHTYNWYKKHGMDLTKAVDKFASKFMAAQYYTQRKKFYTDKSGGKYTPEQASQMALADTDYAIQTTQQSGRAEFFHYAQRSGVVGKLLTQFSGPAFVRWGIEVEALHRAFVMGDKGAKRKLMSKMIALHLVCAPILAMASSLSTLIFKKEDDDTEKLRQNAMRDAVVGMVNGPLTGWFIWGQVMNAGTYNLYNIAAGEKIGRAKHFEAPILSKLGSLQSATSKFAEDVFKYINWGDVNHGMAEDVKEDIVKILNQLVPAWKIERGVRNAIEAAR